ncbi:MAG: amidase family protein [Gammaproteobacteria bacterium]|nr:amidase family protein [Gammaproteobacteria bacterium]
MTGLEMGSDIGGSIRNPAHYCGVFGHKPTWGILPMRGHALPGILTPSDISVIGPLARSAEDLRLAVDIVGGADDLHVPGWDLNLREPSKKSFGELKVAVWADDENAPVDETIKARVLAVAKLIEDAGGDVDYGARPQFAADYSHEQYQYLLHAAMSARQPESMFEENLTRKQALANDDQSSLAVVTRASTQYYREWHARNENRTHLRWAWHEFFKNFDLLLTPMCATSAFPHDQNSQMGARLVTVNNEQRPYFEQIFWAGLTRRARTCRRPCSRPGSMIRGCRSVFRWLPAKWAICAMIEFARQVTEQLGGFVPPSAYED